MSEQENIPTDFDFTSDDVAKASKQPILSEGWYQFVITNAERGKPSKKGHLNIQTRLRALATLNDASSVKGPQVRHGLYLPVKNPAMDDHVPPNTLGLIASFLAATLDEVPDYPRKVAQGVYSWNGTEIEASRWAECKTETDQIVFQAMQNAYRDPSGVLENCAFFGRIKHTTSADGSQTYANIDRVSKELPNNESLVDADNFTSR